jgi:hypothetical protein
MARKRLRKERAEREADELDGIFDSGDKSKKPKRKGF